MADLITKMKSELHKQLADWLNFDLPEEGTEDYSTWQSHAMEIDDIRSFSDIYDYLGGDDDRADEFFSMFGINDFKSKL